MKIINSYDQYDSSKPTVLTMGTFDGVHVGHQSVLKQVANEAVRIGGTSVLLTFFPHPRMVLYPEDSFELIQTIEERQRALSKTSLDYLLVFSFDKKMSTLTAYEFVRDILVARLRVCKLVIGYDHQFGRNRKGNIASLQRYGKEFGFEVIQVGVAKKN